MQEGERNDDPFWNGGWRAVIGDGFTKANVQLLTLALARKMLDEGRADKGFVIGYDRRFLSEEAAGWAAEVMAGQGILCRIIHRESPTPLIMYTVAAYGLPYGMAITASHNPAVYNGIKVFMEGGRDADETLTAAFEGYIRELEGEPCGDGALRRRACCGQYPAHRPDERLHRQHPQNGGCRGHPVPRPARGARPHVRRVQDSAADHLAHHPVRRRGHP